MKFLVEIDTNPSSASPNAVGEFLRDVFWFKRYSGDYGCYSTFEYSKDVEILSSRFQDGYDGKEEWQKRLLLAVGIGAEEMSVTLLVLLIIIGIIVFMENIQSEPALALFVGILVVSLLGWWAIAACTTGLYKVDSTEICKLQTITQLNGQRIQFILDKSGRFINMNETLKQSFPETPLVVEIIIETEGLRAGVNFYNHKTHYEAR